MQDNEKTYENICKFVGKLVIDFSFDMEKLNKKILSLLETISDKDRTIKELQGKLEK